MVVHVHSTDQVVFLILNYGHALLAHTRVCPIAPGLEAGRCVFALGMMTAATDTRFDQGRELGKPFCSMAGQSQDDVDRKYHEGFDHDPALCALPPVTCNAD